MRRGHVDDDAHIGLRIGGARELDEGIGVGQRCRLVCDDDIGRGGWSRHLPHGTIDARAEIDQHIVIAARERDQIVAQFGNFLRRQRGEIPEPERPARISNPPSSYRITAPCSVAFPSITAPRSRSGVRPSWISTFGKAKIAVEQQHALSAFGQRMREGDCEPRFADAALAAGDGQHVTALRVSDR